MLRNIVIILFFFLISCYAQTPKPKNIILFIGDGMGLTQISALKTVTGNPNLDRFKTIGLLTTYSANDYITDSAAGATALATGYKTNNGYISLSPENKPLKTVLEFAIEKGKATGLVATSGINHATPACFAAHDESRKNYNEIAKQMASSGANVLMGGRYENFLPQSHDSSKRKDDLDLIAEMSKTMQVVNSPSEFRNAEDSENLVYLYTKTKPGKKASRPLSLKEMTEKAIEIVSQNDNGFFLMVEGSQIDWGGHRNDAEYIISEIKEFDEAIGAGLDFAEKNKETLVLVTADHETGGFAILDGSVEEKTITQTAFPTKKHTGVMVPLFAYGPQSSIFGGIHDNTFVGQEIIKFNK
jgi:alkaline phosphatase